MLGWILILIVVLVFVYAFLSGSVTVKTGDEVKADKNLTAFCETMPEGIIEGEYKRCTEMNTSTTVSP